MQALSIEEDDSLLTIHDGSVNSITDIKSLVKSAATIGHDHYIRLTVTRRGRLHAFSFWGISMNNERGKLDRGYSVLCELLQLLSQQSAVLPFSNSTLTRLLESELTQPSPSVIITLDKEVEPTGERLRQHLRRRAEEDNPRVMAENLNALKNELFVMENDADAYEDEIRRLRSIINSMYHSCRLC